MLSNAEEAAIRHGVAASRAVMIRSNISNEQFYEYWLARKKNVKYHLNKYRQRSKQYEIPMELTNDQLIEMFNGECWYCGLSPKDSKYGFNGCDRIDPDLPYTVDNCRSCCTDCNVSKGGLTLRQFISQTARISMNKSNFKDTRLVNLEAYSSKSGSNFSALCNSAKAKKRVQNLSFEEHRYITEQHCYLCGNRPEHGCGVDRFDSDDGYELENSYPCCNTCNMMKNTQNYFLFVTRCNTIVKRFSFMFPAELQSVSKNPAKIRMAKRSFVKSGALISRREQSVIRWTIRRDTVGYVDAYIRRCQGEASPQDLSLIEEVKTKIDQEIAKQNKLLLVTLIQRHGDVKSIPKKPKQPRKATIAKQEKRLIAVTNNAQKVSVKATGPPLERKAPSMAETMGIAARKRGRPPGVPKTKAEITEDARIRKQESRANAKNTQ